MNYFYRINFKNPFNGGDAKFIDLHTDHIIEGVYFNRAEILCIFNGQNRLQRVEAIFEIYGIDEIELLNASVITSEFRIDLLENTTSGNTFYLDLVESSDIKCVSGLLVKELHGINATCQYSLTKNSCYKTTILPLGMIFRGSHSKGVISPEGKSGILIQFNSDV